MDYNKINNTDIDGNGNITLQDINGKVITVNYNDTKEFSKLISLANKKLLSKIQKLITDKKYTNQNFDLLPGVKEKKRKKIMKCQIL